MSIENSETFRLLSTANRIREMTITSQCQLEVIKFLMNMCPII